MVAIQLNPIRGTVVVRGNGVALLRAGKDSFTPMPKPPKQGKPLIDLRDDVPRELKVKIRGSVHDQIATYLSFYKASTGQDGNEDKVVDRGLEEFFKSDKAFQTYLQKQPKVSESSPRSSAAPQS